MSSRRPTRQLRPRPVILIFGESPNDTSTLREFLEGLLNGRNISVRIIRKPQVLIKNSSNERARDRVKVLGKLIDAESEVGEVVAVFAHEDCDAVEPAHERVISKIENAFKAAGYSQVYAAAPAWEMEAWLMQWPDAFPKYVASWSAPDKFRGRRVGLIANAKEELDRTVRSSNRGWRESDAARIASIVRREGWIRDPQASSASFKAFLARVDSL